MKGYFGQIEDIDLSICRGAYIINDIYLNKTDTVTKKQTPESHSANFGLAIPSHEIEACFWKCF